ncbi:hypothetical protein OF83DRAFT_1080804 [Amylostereum chailletii]|nr:hypothetical protein OF83DRAFT_1080804 [Amylostereum chailletii]
MSGNAHRMKRSETDKARWLVNHPNFHNSNSSQAEIYLDKQQRGNVAFPPHPRIPITFSCCRAQHESLVPYSGQLIIDGQYEFSDLDEFIVNHVQACVREVQKPAPKDELHLFSNTTGLLRVEVGKDGEAHLSHPRVRLAPIHPVLGWPIKMASIISVNSTNSPNTNYTQENGDRRPRLPPTGSSRLEFTKEVFGGHVRHRDFGDTLFLVVLVPKDNVPQPGRPPGEDLAVDKSEGDPAVPRWTPGERARLRRRNAGGDLLEGAVLGRRKGEEKKAQEQGQTRTRIRGMLEVSRANLRHLPPRINYPATAAATNNKKTSSPAPSLWLSLGRRVERNRASLLPPPSFSPRLRKRENVARIGPSGHVQRSMRPYTTKTRNAPTLVGSMRVDRVDCGEEVEEFLNNVENREEEDTEHFRKAVHHHRLNDQWTSQDLTRAATSSGWTYSQPCRPLPRLFAPSPSQSTMSKPSLSISVTTSTTKRSPRKSAGPVRPPTRPADGPIPLQLLSSKGPRISPLPLPTQPFQSAFPSCPTTRNPRTVCGEIGRIVQRSTITRSVSTALSPAPLSLTQSKASKQLRTPGTTASSSCLKPEALRSRVEDYGVCAKDDAGGKDNRILRGGGRAGSGVRALCGTIRPDGIHPTPSIAWDRKREVSGRQWTCLRGVEDLPAAIKNFPETTSPRTIRRRVSASSLLAAGTGCFWRRELIVAGGSWRWELSSERTLVAVCYPKNIGNYGSRM